MAFMFAFRPCDRYRLVTVSHPVPLRLVDAKGDQFRNLSRGLSAVAVNSRDPGRRLANCFLRFLNVVEAAVSKAAELFVRDVAGCRKTLDAYLKAMGAGIRTGRDGAQWVQTTRRNHAEIARTLLAVGALTAVLADEVFGGRDPFKVDPERSRLKSLRGHGRSRRTDTDRWLRIGRDPSSAPRLEDPRVFDRLMEGLRLVRAPESVRLSHELARHAGNRFCQGREITLYDLLVESDGPCRIPAVNKGSGGERVLTLVVPRSLWDRMMLYVDGERRASGGLGLDELRRMAADLRQRRKLAGMPLFTARGDEPLSYDRLYRIGRRAAARMDLFIDDAEHRSSGVKRFVTFHMLRHEYVHSRLDAIEAMPKAQRAQGLTQLVAYMGWRNGDEMLAWYSAHHSRKGAMAAAVRYSEAMADIQRRAGMREALDRMEPETRTAYPQSLGRAAMAEMLRGL